MRLRGERRWLRIDLDDGRAAAQGFERQGRGGIHDGRRADGEEDVTILRGLHGRFHFCFGQGLFEPDHVRSQWPAAMRALGRDVTSVFPTRNDRAFGEALGARDVPMQLDYVPVAGALMQTVYVLSDEVEVREKVFHFGEREVTRVWFRFGHEFAPPVIPFPHEARIALERARRGQVFGPVWPRGRSARLETSERHFRLRPRRR